MLKDSKKNKLNNNNNEVKLNQLENCVNKMQEMNLKATQECKHQIKDIKIYNKIFKRENSTVMGNISSKIYNVGKDVKIINEDLAEVFKYLNNIQLSKLTSLI